jgi:hypothetical protein
MKDIVIFSCFAGMAYADVQQLSQQKLTIDINGGKWNYTLSQKIDTNTSLYSLDLFFKMATFYFNFSH